MVALLKDVLTGDETSSLLARYLAELGRCERQSQTEDESPIKEEPEVKEEPLSQPLNDESVPNVPQQQQLEENIIPEPEVKEEPRSQPLNEVKEEPLSQPLNDEPLPNVPQQQHVIQEPEVKDEPLSQQLNEVKEEPLSQPFNEDPSDGLQQLEGDDIQEPEVIQVSDDDDDEPVPNRTRQQEVDAHHVNDMKKEKGDPLSPFEDCNNVTDIDNELLATLPNLPTTKKKKKPINRKRKFSESDSDNPGWGDLPDIDGPPSPSLLYNETPDDPESGQLTTASISVIPILHNTLKSKKAKNKTSSKLKAKGKSHTLQKSIPVHNDSDASTDLEGCEPECILLEDEDDDAAQGHPGEPEESMKKPKKSRSKKQKAKDLLLSRMREHIPHSNGTKDHEFLNRLQFVQTACSQDGNTLCFCGKETGPMYWIFRLPGNVNIEIVKITFEMFCLKNCQTSDFLSSSKLTSGSRPFGI